MRCQVFLQNQAEQRFIASFVGIPNLSVEGSTEAEAIARVKTALESQLVTGKFVTIEVGKPLSPLISDPWDPTFDDFLAEV